MADHKANILSEIEQIKDKVAEALAQAVSYGASTAEIAISRQRGLSVSTRNCEVETVEFNQDGALGISVYKGNRKGSASTSDLSEEALRRTVKAACDIAEYTSEDECAGLADKELLEMHPKDLDLYHHHSVSPEEGIALAKAAEQAAFDYSDKIANSDGASFGGYEGFRVYGNTHGQIVGYPSSRYSLTCGMIAGSKQEMRRDHEYTVNRVFSELDPAEKVGRETAKSAVGMLGSRAISTVKAPVIFRADIAGSIFGHLVSAISGGNLYRKSSFLIDKVNTQVLADCVTIEERPHLLRALASSPFDSEGVKTIDRTIVDKGQLQTYLLATYAAKKLGLRSTGHAGGIHNWRIVPTMGGLEQMAKDMGKGMIVTELMGQGVNIVNGDYSRGASGFWVENGEIQFPVSEVTIAANLADLFMNIVGCGSDVDVRGNIQTGSIMISDIQIAGS